jgi:peptidoglycan/xylan/chitin deacetylase (PgdA/CDA1 family)
MKNNTPIAIDINFDSFNAALGFPPGFRDPSFFEVFGRFLRFSDRYGFKYSIYVVGRDLENPDNFARVREWAAMGHEIGNHSYSHPTNLGALPLDRLRAEVGRSHDLIAEATGQEPRGFIAPGWSASARLLSVLIDLGYLYDTSIFPSLLIYPSMLKVAANHLHDPAKLRQTVHRRDYLYPFYKPLRPFLSDDRYRARADRQEGRIVVLPLPALARYRVALWHTLTFVFGVRYVKRQLALMLERLDYFYYLIHPADLSEAADLPPAARHGNERMGVNLAEKMRVMDEMFEVLAASGRPIVTMEEIARDFLRGRTVNSEAEAANAELTTLSVQESTR